jgi:hypothetical protein
MLAVPRHADDHRTILSRLKTRRNRDTSALLTFSNVIKRAKLSSIGHGRRVQIAQNLSNPTP